ncbi:MAG: hypothetical protein EAX90_15710 [Candidatus Heimdallarchaeota archaeon]|nr:hypothetical protein [Candidatus Heimdallarchaeota archaeon]
MGWVVMLINSFKKMKNIHKLIFSCKFNIALQEISKLEVDGLTNQEKIACLILKSIILRKKGLFFQAQKSVKNAIKKAEKIDNKRFLIESLIEEGRILWKLEKATELEEIIYILENDIQNHYKNEREDLNYYQALLNELKAYYFLLILDEEQAIHYANKTLKIKQQLENDVEIINSLLFLARIKSLSFDCEKAINLSLHALNLAKKIDFIEGIFFSNIELGYSYFQKIDYRTAKKYFKKSFQISEEIGNDYFKFLALLGGVFYKTIDRKEALEALLVVYDKMNDFEDPETNRIITSGLAVHYNSMGQPEKALHYIEEALKIYEKHYQNQHSNKYAYLLRTYGQVLMYAGKPSEALEYGQKAIEVCRKIDDKNGLSASLFFTGAFYRRIGELNAAIDCLTEALTIAKELNYERMIIWIIDSLTKNYLEKGELEKALELHQEYISYLNEKGGDKGGISKSKFYLGSIYFEKGDLKNALKYAQESLEIRKQIPNNQIIAKSLFLLVRICIEMNDIDLANRYLDHLTELNVSKDDKIVNHIYRVSNALIKKTSMRATNRAEAEKILLSIISEDISLSEVTIIALINLCELFLDEFRITGDLEVLTELQQYTQKLVEIAKNQDSKSLIFEAQHIRILSLWLQAQHSTKEVNLKEIRDLLTNTQKLAEKQGLNRLAQKIFNKHNKMLEHLEIWDEFLRSYYELIKT